MNSLLLTFACFVPHYAAIVASVERDRLVLLQWKRQRAMAGNTESEDSVQKADVDHKGALTLPEQNAREVEKTYEVAKNKLLGDYGFDKAGQNLSVNPGDDFFTYANGKYIADLQMPKDRSSWGSFDVLNDKAIKRVKGILEEDEKAGGKMGKLYHSYMNTEIIETLDIDPISNTMLLLKSISDRSDYARLAGGSVNNFLPSPFFVGIGPDPKDNTNYCVSIDQGGLGLPRDYYLEDSFASKKKAYKKYAAELLRLGNWAEPEAASEAILALENKIANVSWSEAEQRDPIKTYNKMDGLKDLQQRAPGFDWGIFLEEAGNLPGKAKLIVGALSGVVDIAKILNETDMHTLRAHAAFHYLSVVAPLLSDRFVQTAFRFTQVMTGQEKQLPRWKRAVGTVNQNMGFAVGRTFVEKYFPPSSKKIIQELTLEVKSAFKKRISNVDWMTEATKKAALHKLASFDIQVGYPKKWRDYTNLTIDENDLVGNLERATAFGWKRSLNKLGTPVDRDEWLMTPQTVNAYNNPSSNQVVFPAAILQPPFFDPEADMAVNFGGIGAVIGHEMTHGFDDQGRHYDANGQLKDWWTEEDAAKFKEKAHAYTKQFASFDLGIPNAHIKPDLTAGEDIADLGGVTLGLQAYETWRSKQSPAVPDHPNRVFLGWAQLWREKRRQEALLSQLVADPHPPSQARVNVPMANIDSWYTAFNVTVSNKEYRSESDRVVIW